MPRRAVAAASYGAVRARNNTEKLTFPLGFFFGVCRRSVLAIRHRRLPAGSLLMDKSTRQSHTDNTRTTRYGGWAWPDRRRRLKNRAPRTVLLAANTRQWFPYARQWFPTPRRPGHRPQPRTSGLAKNGASEGPASRLPASTASRPAHVRVGDETRTDAIRQRARGTPSLITRVITFERWQTRKRTDLIILKLQSIIVVLLLYLYLQV